MKECEFVLPKFGQQSALFWKYSRPVIEDPMQDTISIYYTIWFFSMLHVKYRNSLCNLEFGPKAFSL